MKHTIKLLSAIICISLSSSAMGATQAATAKTTAKLPISDLERFTTVIEYIKNYYVNEVEDPALFESAIRGMLAGLDPHSAYLDPEEFADLKASTTGKFGGLGIEVTLEDGYIKVITPIDDSPAAKGGLKSGDLIIRIDDSPVKDMDLRASVDKMRGKPGSTVDLTVIRKGETKPLKFKLTRETINVHSVTSKMLEDGYAYVRISQFQDETGPELTKALKEILKNSNGKLKGLVLDLRNNPGGVLDASVQVASAFLDKDKLGYEKMVVFTKGRLPGSQVKEKATGKDLLNGIPVIVLVNSGSASAAEIVAGALQDHKRAVILGTETFGKASVQTVLPLKDQRGLKLTTALYYTPSGKSIQAKGIVPDIVVEELAIPKPKADDNAFNDLMLYEADLDRHLESKPADQSNSTNAPATKGKAKSDGKDAKADPASMYTDYQLNQALNVLKAQQALSSNK